MKHITILLIASAIIGCFVVTLAASDNDISKERLISRIDELSREVKQLRRKVADLEKRLEKTESTLREQLWPFEILQDPYRQELKWLPEKTPRGDLDGWKNDKGLYVFPGIDAPPLTPMDELRNRMEK